MTPVDVQVVLHGEFFRLPGLCSFHRDAKKEQTQNGRGQVVNSVLSWIHLRGW